MEKNASKTNYKLDCICEIQTATTTFIACSTRFRLIVIIIIILFESGNMAHAQTHTDIQTDRQT